MIWYELLRIETYIFFKEAVTFCWIFGFSYFYRLGIAFENQVDFDRVSHEQNLPHGYREPSLCLGSYQVASPSLLAFPCGMCPPPVGQLGLSSQCCLQGAKGPLQWKLGGDGLAEWVKSLWATMWLLPLGMDSLFN